MTKRILMIVTSHDRLGETDTPTGFWLEELATPYRVLAAAGAEIDIASPKGGAAPVDPKSRKTDDADVAAFLADEAAMAKLEATRRLDAVDDDYDAYFVVGGHGVMWDLAADETAAKLLARAFDSGRVVAAVCHGPAALVGVTLADESPLVAGRRVAGFSNEEERAAELENIVPFALESRLTELGGRYERGPMWKPFALRDGRLVTGQNPASSRRVAELTLEALSSSA